MQAIWGWAMPMRETLLCYSPTINITTDFVAWAQRPELMNNLALNMALTSLHGCLVAAAVDLVSFVLASFHCSGQ
jgi:hypothetical protein